MENEQIHDNIKIGKIEEVRRNIAEQPNDKYFYNAACESASATALNWNRADIYELLLSKGIWIGPFEDFKKLTQGFDEPSHGHLRKINQKFFKESDENHLIILKLRSKVHHATLDHEKEELFEKIRDAFDDLNKCRWIKPILQAVATASELSIAFDFNSDYVHQMVPNRPENEVGTFYADGSIYIAAKALRDRDRRCEALGIIAHECAHYAMKLIYDNQCKPYSHCDVEKLNKFVDVVNKSKAKVNGELIRSVFNYPFDNHAELIVVVPNLEALYMSNPLLQEVSYEYSELFDFYQTITFTDLTQKLPRLLANREIMEINEQARVVATLNLLESPFVPNALNINIDENVKTLQITSNCSTVVVKGFFEQMKRLPNFDCSFVFIELKTLKIDKMFEVVEKASKLCTQPWIIIDCIWQEHEMVNEIANKLSDREMNERIVFVTDEGIELIKVFPDIRSYYKSYSWNDFTVDYKEMLLHRQIVFQGKEMEIRKILDRQTFDSGYLEDLPLNQLITKQLITIGSAIKFKKIDSYIERKFLDPRNKGETFLTDLYHTKSSNWNQWSSNDYASEENDDFFLRDLIFKNQSTFDDVMAHAETQKGVLLCDIPGMGKSTAFKMFAQKLNETFPRNWVIFMDLKKHYKVYRKDGNDPNDIQSSQEVAKFFCSKILKIGSFEAQIFVHLFNESRVIFVMDGFDEICPSFKFFILKIMKGIKLYTKNQLWISTRPHLTKLLQNELNLPEVRLKPLSGKDCKDFFENFFRRQNTGMETTKTLMAEIKLFFHKLQMKSWSSGPIRSPLVMKLIVEYIEQDANAKLTDLFSLYQTLIEKMYEKCMYKGPEAKRDISKVCASEGIRKYFQREALLAQLKMDEVVKFVYFQNIPKLTEDQVTRTGLMYSDESKQLNFIHGTFEEFLIAQFIQDMIHDYNGSKECKKDFMNIVEDILFSEGQSMIRTFLDHSFKPFSMTDKNLKLLLWFQNFFEKSDCPLDYLHTLVQDGCMNTLELLTLVNSSQQIWLHKKDDSFGYKRREDCYYSILITAIRHQPLLNIEKLWRAMTKCLTTDSIKQLLLDKTHARSIFHDILLSSTLEVFDFFMKKSEVILGIEACQTLVTANDFNGWNVFHYVIDGNLNFGKLFDMLRPKLQFQQLLSLMKSEESLSKMCGSVVILACQNKSHNLQELCEAIKKLFIDLDKRKTFFLEIYDDALMIAAENIDLDCFKILWEFLKEFIEEPTLKEFLLKKDQDLSVFHLAIKNKNSEIFDFILTLYKQLFDEEEMSELILENIKGENILFYSCGKREEMNLENFETLWAYMQELLEVPELKFVLHESNQSNRTIFWLADCYALVEVLETLMLFVEKNYSKAEKLRLNQSPKLVGSKRNR